MPYKIILILFISLSALSCSGDNMKTGTAVSDYIIKVYPDPASITSKGWEYNNSIVLYGMAKIYAHTGKKEYLDYIRSFVDKHVDGEGNINFNKDDNNLDHIHPGLLLLFLYEQTHDQKYMKAAYTLRREFDNQPRNEEGGYWHKQRYENEMWLDGIYMAEPFLIKFGYMFNDREYCEKEASYQTILIARHTQDSKTGLLYHGWDANKNADWADIKTGLSGQFWSRSIGWYVMALVEILEYMPEDHKDYKTLIAILNKAAEGIKNSQDPKTGLWYQVTDKGILKDNWIELSGSAMFVYALKTAADKGYIDKKYIDTAKKGWNGIKSRIKISESGLVKIPDAVEGMGVQTDYKGYINKGRLTNSTHGFCAVLMASSVMEY